MMEGVYAYLSSIRHCAHFVSVVVVCSILFCPIPPSFLPRLARSDYRTVYRQQRTLASFVALLFYFPGGVFRSLALPFSLFRSHHLSVNPPRLCSPTT